MTERTDPDKLFDALVEIDPSKVDLTNLETVRRTKEDVANALLGFHLVRLNKVRGIAPGAEEVQIKIDVMQAGYNFLSDIERQLEASRQTKTQQRQFWATMLVGGIAAVATLVYAIAYIFSLRGYH